MANRDGSLSSFPSSLDDFVIKFPYNNDRINGTSASRNDLERAIHFNHMFDACYKLQRELRVVGGADLFLPWSYTEGASSLPLRDEGFSGTDIVLSYATETKTLSGITDEAADSWEFTFQTPEIFGNDPFLDHEFAVHVDTVLNIKPDHNNLYRWPDLVRSIFGLPADFHSSNFGKNHMIQQMLEGPNLYCTTYPVSGRYFKVFVENKPMNTNEDVRMARFYDDGARPAFTTDLGSKWANLFDPNWYNGSGRTTAFGSAFFPGITSSVTPLVDTDMIWLSSENAGVYELSSALSEPKYGFFVPTYITGASSMSISALNYWQLYNNINGTTYYNGVGLAVRMTASPLANTVSFYGLLLGEYTNPNQTVRLIRVNNLPINTVFNQTTAIHSQTATISSLGTFTTSNIIVGTLTLGATGDTIWVTEKVGMGAPTLKLSVTDSSASKLRYGKPGIFALAMRSTTPPSQQPARYNFFKNIEAKILDDERVGDLTFKFVYAKVGGGKRNTYLQDED